MLIYRAGVGVGLRGPDRGDPDRSSTAEEGPNDAASQGKPSRRADRRAVGQRDRGALPGEGHPPGHHVD
jgi:hypothetical protein